MSSTLCQSQLAEDNKQTKLKLFARIRQQILNEIEAGMNKSNSQTVLTTPKIHNVNKFPSVLKVKSC